MAGVVPCGGQSPKVQQTMTYPAAPEPGHGALPVSSVPSRQPLQCPPLEMLRFDDAGLIPAIAQDWLDGAVLMVAWMNRVSLEQTVATGEAHYWSRSRQELWHKGSTSGHCQRVRKLRYDCDQDVLLLTVEQVGDVACHTGARSCFYNSGAESSPGGPHAPAPPADAVSELYQLIVQRRQQPEDGSYTNALFRGGDNRILKKIGEESAELVMACKDDDANAISAEAADVLYHMLVALAYHGVPWRQVLLELAQRRNKSRPGQANLPPT